MYHSKSSKLRDLVTIGRIKQFCGSQFFSGIEFIHKPTYNYLGRKYFNSRYSSDLRDFDIPLSAFKVININPNDIEYISRRTWVPWRFKHHAFGKVLGGNWDKSEYQFESFPIFEALQQRYAEQQPWEEIEYMQTIRSKLESGQRAWHCDSITEFNQRCNQIDEIFEDISAGRYKSQRELIEGPVNDHLLSGYEPPAELVDLDELTESVDMDEYYDQQLHQTKNQQVELLEKYLHEVKVDIGRDGELLFVDGQNRLSLAKIANIDEIPVVVVVRHEQWLETLEDRYEQHRLPDHPDTVELRADERQSSSIPISPTLN